MMNKLQFFNFCREQESKFSPGFRHVEGAVRMNSNESAAHFRTKAIVMWYMKRWDFVPADLSDVVCEGAKLTRKDLPKWYSARVYSEVRVGNSVWDIVAFTIYGTFVFEIVESESEESLKRKERAAMNLGWAFEKVYC